MSLYWLKWTFLFIAHAGTNTLSTGTGGEQTTGDNTGVIAAAVVVVIFIVIILVVILVSVFIRIRGNKNNHIDDPMYDYPDELPPPPIPQPRTNQIQVTTNTAYASATLLNDAPDVIYETIMDTTNPAYGITLSVSAGISVDTNIAYDMVKDTRTTATNSAQQQDETPPATNPTFEDARDFEVAYK